MSCNVSGYQNGTFLTPYPTPRIYKHSDHPGEMILYYGPFAPGILASPDYARMKLGGNLGPSHRAHYHY